jgi:hypothetical protein
MASKFQDFLKTHKIDSRRIPSASSNVEKLRPEDRLLRLKRRNAKKAESATEGEKGPKPRSGRPVTPLLLSKALEGKVIPGPAKTRLLRAVNRILEQKKKEPVDLRALF